jgi:phosphatidylglycerol:prolipoprotein diacylglycerol transferase
MGTGIWWLRKENIPYKPVLDIAAFSIPVVHIFGRLGCFLAGCCYGKVCTSSIGVTFTHPETLAMPQNVPLFPTQLFDLGLNLAILLIVFLLEKRKKFEGQLFLVYLMIYAVGRSVIEIYRGDEARGFLFGGALSHSQFIAILLFLGCLFFWSRWEKQPLNVSG